jgi:ribosomal protein S25
LQRAKPLINHKKDKEKKGGREDGRERETERKRERDREIVIVPQSLALLDFSESS